MPRDACGPFSAWFVPIHSAWLGLAWLISTSLPQFLQLMGKINKWQCETKLWFYANDPVISWNNNAQGTAGIAGDLVKGFTGVSTENNSRCFSDFSFSLFYKR